MLLMNAKQRTFLLGKDGRFKGVVSTERRSEAGVACKPEGSDSRLLKPSIGQA